MAKNDVQEYVDEVQVVSDEAKEVVSSNEVQKPTLQTTSSEEFVSLAHFAQSYAKKYGIELMGGFYQVQEVAKHFADTESNWHDLMEKFKNKEVK